MSVLTSRRVDAVATKRGSRYAARLQSVWSYALSTTGGMIGRPTAGAIDSWPQRHYNATRHLNSMPRALKTLP
jgi:hypothetical protein